jgi:hypothetical protein
LIALENNCWKGEIYQLYQKEYKPNKTNAFCGIIMVTHNKDFIWLTIQGVEKREILEGLGFRINESGILSLNGKEVTALDNPKEKIRAVDVKAVLPGSLTVITDISEVEMLSPAE